MSRRCIGHVDGHSLWEDEGPGAARVMGHGGRMLLAGDLVTSSITIKRSDSLTIPTPNEVRRSKERSAKYWAEKAAKP